MERTGTWRSCPSGNFSIVQRQIRLGEQLLRGERLDVMKVEAGLAPIVPIEEGEDWPEDHRSRCLAPFAATAKCPVQEAVDHQIEQVGVYLVAAGLEVIGDAHEVFNDDCYLVKGEPDWTLTG